ncbi:11548_t:CDS:2 [Dentiscutata heterogama]|uniref:11548_t:CDS:1 n=1 Tax=Dentiscutata heterogama TaxID=1316150 RepID=A0ACA9KGD2_9GLOM|nr:11548_t:CDS:2 [Dentiscutata heterogama]
MLEFIQLPLELFYLIFHKLDEQALRSLARVSRYCNILISDNVVWSRMALNRWEDKEGMREVCDRNRRFWFESPGAWKRVYDFVEKEATRISLDANDLVENIWYCAPIDNPRDTLVEFYQDGTYIHHLPFKQYFSWTIASDGSICLNQKPFRSYRCPNWNLIISNDYLVFKSSGAESFKRKLREFNFIGPEN